MEKIVVKSELQCEMMLVIQRLKDLKKASNEP